MEHWSDGTMVHQNNGAIELWNNGVVEQRNAGTMEPWSNGPMEAMDQRSIGTVEQCAPALRLMK
eukprot:1742632-Lingulodinium_polyedra.AAC.1